jgi:hypothetical protein
MKLTPGPPNFSACANWQTFELMSQAKAEHDDWDKHRPPHSMLFLNIIKMSFEILVQRESRI